MNEYFLKVSSQLVSHNDLSEEASLRASVTRHCLSIPFFGYHFALDQICDLRQQIPCELSFGVQSLERENSNQSEMEIKVLPVTTLSPKLSRLKIADIF